MNKPEQLDGTEELIGEIQATTQLVTSKWGDEHMYFRHQRFDEDLKYQPEWLPFTPTLEQGDERSVRDPSLKKPTSGCPFAAAR